MHSQPITIRRLGPEDAHILDRRLPGLLEDAADPNRVWRFLAGRANAMVVALAEGRVVALAYGTAMNDPQHDDAFFLVEVRVAESFRRQGIARRLIGRLRDDAAERGCLNFWLLAEPENPDAHALYEALGGEPQAQNSWYWAL